MGSPHTTTAVIYGRQSLGHESSISEQLDIGRRRADSEGWKLHAVYSDRVSASRHGKAARGNWDKLRADVTSGRARIVWLWESSRGDRRASSWLAFLEDCRTAGVHVYVETHAREYDMTNPRDWRNLAEDGTDNEYESEKIRARVLRSMQARAERGEPHGRTPYGYRREYELTSTGKRIMLGQVPDPVEAPIVREMYRRLGAGDSLRSLARDLEARGIRTRSGLVFSAQHIRDLVLRHTYAGLRAHSHGGAGHRPGAAVDVVPGTWEPLVDRETWYRVTGILKAPDRRTSRPGRATHVYSMIIVCDVCGGPASVSLRRPGGEYVCRDAGHVKIAKQPLEDLLDRLIVAYPSRADVYAELRAHETSDDGGELQTVRGELAAARDELAALRDGVARGSLSVANLTVVEPGMTARIATLEARERDLSTPAPLLAIPPGKDVARRWKAAQVSAKREVARLLLSPQILGQARIKRSPSRGHRVPVEDRVGFSREATTA